jgi:hypothetical protein
VASNLPFLVVALFAGPAVARWAREARPPAWARAAAWTLLAGVGLTAAGSVVYHLDPRNATLVVDRLPMALTFGAFFALLLGDRLGDGVGRRAFVPSVVLAVGSVAAWAATLGTPGADDLPVRRRAVPAAARASCSSSGCRRRRRQAAVVAHGARGVRRAKRSETLDARVFDLTGGLVSRHTLKAPRGGRRRVGAPAVGRRDAAGRGRVSVAGQRSSTTSSSVSNARSGPAERTSNRPAARRGRRSGTACPRDRPARSRGTAPSSGGSSATSASRARGQRAVRRRN